MKGKELFKTGITFEEFVNKDSNSYREKTLEIYNKIDFHEVNYHRIEKIEKKINILICAEIWCPDCMINVPVLEKMRETNKNISISIVEKAGNEEYFKYFNEEDVLKIPTFVFFDEEFKILGSFIERPSIVKEVQNSKNQPAIIVTMRKYKRGEYTENTLVEILNILGY